MYVDIELEGEYTRGATVADFLGSSQQAPNVVCMMDIDRDRYVELLTEALKSYAGRSVPV
jgi:inosine-uridine nucleoside N-ribohydrolase